MDGKRPLVFVPRAQIERIELVHGCAAERPIVMIAVGLCLIGIAAFAVAWLALAFVRHGIFYANAITAIAFVIPGLWLLDLSLRMRWLLLVHTRQGRRKLMFKTSKDETALQSFVTSARSRFGYF